MQPLQIQRSTTPNFKPQLARRPAEETTHRTSGESQHGVEESKSDKSKNDEFVRRMQREAERRLAREQENQLAISDKNCTFKPCTQAGQPAQSWAVVTYSWLANN